jgi:hypothetical protein
MTREPDTYWTCDECAHVETRPPHADDPEKCENCGYWECVEFADLEDAEDYSERVLADREVK